MTQDIFFCNQNANSDGRQNSIVSLFSCVASFLVACCFRVSSLKRFLSLYLSLTSLSPFLFLSPSSSNQSSLRAFFLHLPTLFPRLHKFVN